MPIQASGGDRCRWIHILVGYHCCIGNRAPTRRWVVERTFGWLVRHRRLARDYEQRLDVSQAMIHIATGSVLLRRLFVRMHFRTGSQALD